jgi:hypothetical protein
MCISLPGQGMMGTPPQLSAVVSKSKEEDHFSEIFASMVYVIPNINFNFQMVFFQQKIYNCMKR